MEHNPIMHIEWFDKSARRVANNGGENVLLFGHKSSNWHCIVRWKNARHTYVYCVFNQISAALLIVYNSFWAYLCERKPMPMEWYTRSRIRYRHRTYNYFHNEPGLPLSVWTEAGATSRSFLGWRISNAPDRQALGNRTAEQTCSKQF